MSDRILVCVGWPYANYLLHVGQAAGAYLPADIFARFQRLKGNEVLMVSDGTNVKIGKPVVAGAKVTGEVTEIGRHDKIRIVKFRRRKHYRKQQGHRQWYTAVKITGIQG